MSIPPLLLVPSARQELTPDQMLAFLSSLGIIYLLLLFGTLYIHLAAALSYYTQYPGPCGSSAYCKRSVWSSYSDILTVGPIIDVGVLQST